MSSMRARRSPASAASAVATVDERLGRGRLGAGHPGGGGLVGHRRLEPAPGPLALGGRVRRAARARRRASVRASSCVAIVAGSASSSVATDCHRPAYAVEPLAQPASSADAAGERALERDGAGEGADDLTRLGGGLAQGGGPRSRSVGLDAARGPAPGRLGALEAASDRASVRTAPATGRAWLAVPPPRELVEVDRLLAEVVLLLLELPAAARDAACAAERR